MSRLLPSTATLAALALSASAAGAASDFGGHTRKSVRFLALGDSYTIGEGVAEHERWPEQLAATLADNGYEVGVKVVARTGWTTDELWDALQDSGIEPPFDLVTLLIGVNNQYRGRGLNEYREQFCLLLQKAVDYGGGEPGQVIVLSIPDWGRTPFGAAREPGKVSSDIDQFNAINREESSEAGAHYVDITPETRADGRDPDFIASDGLHPSAKMYAAWTALLLPSALVVLAH